MAEDRPIEQHLVLLLEPDVVSEKNAIAFAACAHALLWCLPAQADDTSLLRASRRLSPSSLAAMGAMPAPAPALNATIPSSALTLSGAVRFAVDRHPSIGEAISVLKQQYSGIDVARAGYYPAIRAGLGGSRTNGVNERGISTVATASVSQMLYDFGKVAGSVNYAEAQVNRQQAAVLKQIDSVAQQAADAVVMAHRYQVILEVAKAQVDNVEKVLELAQLRAGAGISTQADPIQARARLDGAQANFLQLRALHSQWRERLRTLLGGAPPDQIASLPEEWLQSLQMGQDTDPQLLPDVLQAQADRRIAVAQLEIAKAQRFPTISLDASANKALGGLSPATLSKNGTSHTLAINLTSTFYQGGALDAQVRSAIAAEEAATQRIEITQLNAGDQARSLREQAVGARARTEMLVKRKLGILRVRDLYREQYTLGTRSILDLLNAEQEIYQAATEEETVRHDLWQSVVSYIGVAGLGRSFYGLDNTTIQGLEVLP